MQDSQLKGQKYRDFTRRRLKQACRVILYSCADSGSPIWEGRGPAHGMVSGVRATDRLVSIGLPEEETDIRRSSLSYFPASATSF